MNILRALAVFGLDAEIEEDVRLETSFYNRTLDERLARDEALAGTARDGLDGDDLRGEC